MDQSSHKRSSFRNQIRRRQIQQLFSQGRQKFASQQSEKQSQRIRKLTQTPSARNFFILSKKQQFNKNPQKDWCFILKELLISVKYFDKDFQGWIDAGFISIIVSLFKKQNRWLNFMDLAALLLQAIFYYLPSDSPQVKTILNYNFIPDLIELCSYQDIKTINYLELINTILYQREKLKELFIVNGFVQTLSIRLKKYQNLDTQQVFTSLTVLFRLVKIYGNHCIPNGNIISVFLPILDVYIAATKDKENLRIILKAISALAMTKKQSVLADIFRCKNIIPLSLELLCSGQTAQIRAGAANILASILGSKYLHFSRKLIEMGAIDFMLKCVTNPVNHQLCLLCILTCLSNLISNSYEETCFVFSHQIFREFLIPCSKATDNLKFHQQAIFAICSMIEYQNKIMISELLQNYGLLEILVGGLSCFAPNLKISLQILRSLNILINMYSGDYENIVVLDLHRYFRIENVLNNLDEGLKNKQVHQKIEQLCNLMHKSQQKMEEI